MKVWVYLAIGVIVIYLAYPYFSPSVGGLSETQAKEFVLEDVKPLTNIGIETRFVNIQKQPSQWAVDVLLTTNAHSSCPVLEKRFYTLLPIGFRSESVVRDCNEKVEINYREEAMIQSARKMSVPSGTYGCAFFGREYKTNEAKSYCTMEEESALDSFTSDVAADAWVVAWYPGGLMALSKNGQVLKRG